MRSCHVRWELGPKPRRRETLGREPAWNEARAQRELGVRLAAVERERYRRPQRVTFAEFAERWEREYLPGRNLKPSTASDYGSILRGRLLPYFGAYELAALGPEAVDGYIAEATAAGLAPNTISNHLGLLRVMFKVALRWRLVARSPMREVEAPRPRQPELSVLTEPEIARLLAAYREAEQEAEPEEREWWPLARRLVEVALGTAMRRGELLALRWRDVELVEGRLHVREALVRGRFGSPKSRASRRMIELGPRTLGVLEEQFAAAGTARTRASCSATRRWALRSTPRRSRGGTSARRSAELASRSPSAPGTTSGIPP
jgi:integrase